MRSFVIALSAISLAPGAFAAVPAVTKDEARRTAALHLQVEVLDVSEACVVSAKVVTVFRDKDDDVSVGDRINFNVCGCIKARGRVGPPPLGEYVAYESVSEAKYIEAYLDRIVVARQLRVIDAPSKKPQFEAEELASLHLQVEVVGSVTEDHQKCDVTAKVITIFSDEGSDVSPGDRISFKVPGCYKKPVRGKRLAPGVYWGYEYLAGAKYIEAHLDRIVAKWQLRVIDAPSVEPQFPVEP